MFYINTLYNLQQFSFSKDYFTNSQLRIQLRVFLCECVCLHACVHMRMDMYVPRNYHQNQAKGRKKRIFLSCKFKPLVCVLNWESGIKVPARSGSGGGLLGGGCTLLHMAASRAEASSLMTLIKELIPLVRVPS